MFLGDYAENFPPGILTLEEEETISVERSFQWANSFNGIDYFDFVSPIDGAAVLRNLCSREYISNRLFSGELCPALLLPCYKSLTRRFATPTGENRHPRLFDALMSRIAWTTDPGMALPGPHLFQHGTWAGARLDIALPEDVIGSDWKDITETVFFEVYRLWELDVRMCPDESPCQLCKKYLEMQEELEDDLERPVVMLHPASSSVIDQAPLAAAPQSGASNFSPASTSTQQTSSFALCAPEIHSIILSHLNAADLVSCALLCRSINGQATRLLYRHVWAKFDEMCILEHTLIQQPELQTYIRKLELRFYPDWESRMLMKLILIQLPRLLDLWIDPCWLSCDDMASWGCPFQLESLYWGLMLDNYFIGFLRSQPSITKIAFPEGYLTAPVDTFQVPRDILPRLQTVKGDKAVVKRFSKVFPLSWQDGDFFSWNQRADPGWRRKVLFGRRSPSPDSTSE